MGEEAVDVSMNELAFKVLNGPVSILSLVAYIFYAFCLFCPQDGADVPRQPLKVLLVTLVTDMTALQIINLFHVVVEFSLVMWYVLLSIMFYLIECSLTIVVWLNTFYYTQIVPPQSDNSIRLKKNIKFIVYSVLVFDQLFYLSDMAIYAVPALSFMSSINSTLASSNASSWDSLELPKTVFYISRVVYIFLSLVVMMASSCATVSYLRRHLKIMKSSRSPFTSSLQSQKRVATTGIVQIVLYFLCAMWLLLQNFFYLIYMSIFDYHILYTVICLYSFGTAINLGVSQSLFRRKIIDLCQRVSAFFNS